jgi:hypothetical protein
VAYTHKYDLSVGDGKGVVISYPKMLLGSQFYLSLRKNYKTLARILEQLFALCLKEGASTACSLESFFMVRGLQKGVTLQI